MYNWVCCAPAAFATNEGVTLSSMGRTETYRASERPGRVTNEFWPWLLLHEVAELDVVDEDRVERDRSVKGDEVFWGNWQGS